MGSAENLRVLSVKVGEVVRYLSKRWRVLSHSTEFRTCVLSNFEGESAEVPDDFDTSLELKVLYNPSNWPFVTIPVKQTFGRILRVTRSHLDLDTGKSDTVTLQPMVDWIPGDFLKGGGSIFFNPALRLKSGEILLAVHENTKSQRIAITKNFGSMKARKARKAKPKAPSNNYQKILKDDVFGKD